MRGLHMENLVLGEDDLKREAGIKTLCYPRALLILTLFNIIAALQQLHLLWHFETGVSILQSS